MKQTTIFLLCFLLFGVQIFAQTNSTKKPKQSALTMQYVSMSKAKSALSMNSKVVKTQINQQEYVNAFIKVNNQLQESKLETLGIRIGTKAGNIWTVKIPVENVEKLTLMEKGIDVIELDQPLSFNMEEARAKTNVDKVHSGTNLPQAYTGKDVVVGILDVGFDYTHPTFYDEEGINYRIKRIWEQKTEGIPPLSYSYGHEMIDVSEMIAQQTDKAENSHGAHVAGIAAGSGFGGNGSAYRGVAYESDLVFVGITPAQDQWKNTGMTDIIDGLNYIFEYADSQGKPAVANLSWGASIGPHDGTSLFAQALDNLTGEGKIFTVSAGNNGGNNLHLGKEFSTSDNLLQSFISFSSNLPEKKTWVDVWGEEGESFCLQLKTYNNFFMPHSSTELICLENTTIDTFLIGTDADTFHVNITTVASDINGKPHAFLDIYSQTNDRIALSIQANSGKIDAWMGYVLETRGYYGNFVSNSISGFTAGNDKYTIGEMACSAAAIAVGAYASKTLFTNLAGQSLNYNNYVLPDRICPFSSKGPTTDGRVKPDITAPGMTIASAVNSFDSNYTPGGDNYNMVVHQYMDTATNHDYFFGESSGTSMSAPMVAGIVALLLEANPFSTPEEIKTLMVNTSINDEFTTDNPDTNIWGFGKIDAHAMLQSVKVSSVEEKKMQDVIIYPNPTDDDIQIELEGIKSIVFSDMMGKTVLTIKTNDTDISLKNFATGIYILSVYSEDNILLTQQKIVKL